MLDRLGDWQGGESSSQQQAARAARPLSALFFATRKKRMTTGGRSKCRQGSDKPFQFLCQAKAGSALKCPIRTGCGRAVPYRQESADTGILACRNSRLIDQRLALAQNALGAMPDDERAGIRRMPASCVFECVEKAVWVPCACCSESRFHHGLGDEEASVSLISGVYLGTWSVRPNGRQSESRSRFPKKEVA